MLVQFVLKVRIARSNLKKRGLRKGYASPFAGRADRNRFSVIEETDKVSFQHGSVRAKLLSVWVKNFLAQLFEIKYFPMTCHSYVLIGFI